MRNKILIIDGNNFLYRSHFSHIKLNNKGKPVSAIYGMPQIISSVLKKIKPTKVITCWDGLKHPRRLELVPSYKEKRLNLGKDFEVAKAQRPIVMKMLDYLGIYQHHDITLEADDYIYYLVRSLRKKNDIIIASADKDFHQLLRKGVTIWDDRNNKLITHKNCKALFGYSPKNCVEYLAMTGDKSDGIPGVGGVGPVKAIKILEQFYENPDNVSKAHFRPIIESMGFNWDKFGKTILINREMIELKFFYERNLKGNKALKKPDLSTPRKFKPKAFKKICDEYHIKVLKSEAFLKPFEKLCAK